MKAEQFFLASIVLFIFAVLLILLTPGLPDEVLPAISGLAALYFGYQKTTQTHW